MSTMHQYDYVFAIGVMFAALDAYNIGANDVANSFATSVASRSLTLRQACIAAGLCEFLGAVLVGARVSSTIKNGIMALSIFRGNAGVQMLGFTCALTASASWLMFCTHNSWTVSTTYSIVSALAGSAVAIGGGGAVQWGWNNARGVSAIYAGMVIAPAISAGFGATVYLISYFAALSRKNPVRAAMILSPFYFFTVAAVLTMSIVYKGAPSLNLSDLPPTTVALAIVLTGLVIAILSLIFWLPYVHAKVIKHDYTIKWYHFFYGPLLWRRPAPEVSLEAAAAAVPDYRTYGREDDDDAYHRGADAGADIENRLASDGTRQLRSDSTEGQTEGPGSSSASANENGPDEKNADTSVPLSHKQNKYIKPEAKKHDRAPLSAVEADSREHPIEGPWILPRNLWIIVRYKIPKVLLHGSSVDVHKLQLGGPKSEQRIAEMHQIAKQYDNEVEHLYSFLQVLTACTNSFAHGANDVSNAIGPFAAIYHTWSTGTITNSRTDTPVWLTGTMLAFGGAMIVIGLATYGYNIMAVIGNRLTMHSPSRGFSMEFGASITVLLATQYAIPVSTTMCICGATAGVGLVSSGWRALNYRGFGWIILGWILTVPIAGLLGGILTGLFLNAPHF